VLMCAFSLFLPLKADSDCVTVIAIYFARIDGCRFVAPCSSERFLQ
jgi:hypothetical protein